MKKIVVLVVLLVFVSCKEEVVKKPNRLIEKDVMVNIMYDLSLLEAIKYQSPAILDSNKISPKQYIYKKYKVDSLQFAQSNVYYASDYEEYKNMFEQMTKRLDQKKLAVEALIKAEKKKKKETKKAKSALKKKTDSLELNRRKKLD
ncbi:DUF4296 domain-containing protein [Flavobacterium lacustre]|jgi:hypothetical protein|uniref:DUF4296 domain-containing protein n=1 Tax=Flavobacterium lacustre TaxID=3016339 RepID=UPI0022B644A7|nr:DUF4296 domain-containing protein [Flavobacterium lacustre]